MQAFARVHVLAGCLNFEDVVLGQVLQRDAVVLVNREGVQALPFSVIEWTLLDTRSANVEAPSRASNSMRVKEPKSVSPRVRSSEIS